MTKKKGLVIFAPVVNVTKRFFFVAADEAK